MISFGSQRIASQNKTDPTFVAPLFASALSFFGRGLATQTNPPQPERDQATLESCKKFVQTFYDWYLSKEAAAGKLAIPSVDAVLKRKANVLSPELYQRLKEDGDAAEKCKGEICGLDFDPFLNSQDASPRFEAVRVSLKGSGYRVDVYGIESGKRREHVIPELVQQNGHWIFVNFHYERTEWTDGGDLLSTLKELRAEREKNP